MLHLVLPLLLLTGDDEAWPEYRGPAADGHARVGSDPPLTWSEDENVAWKTPIRGRGWSTPVVLDGVAWLTSATATGEEQYVIAVDVATGEVVRDELVWGVEEPEDRNQLNSYASPSPVLAPGRVFLHFGTYGTVCLDAETGERLWERRDLNCDHMEGPGSSPILWEDLLIVHVDGGDVQYVAALDQETGDDVWRTARTADLSPFPPDLRKAYATPIVVDVDGAPQLISSGAQATYGYDPRTGDEQWRLDHGGFSMSSRILHRDGVVYVNTGYMRPELWAVRLGGEGVLEDDHVDWVQRKSIPTMPSPVLVDDLLFLVSDGGTATCVDTKDGEQLWRARLGGDFCASPVLAGGRLYFPGRDGVTTVLQPAREHVELARNELDAGCMASPIVVGDALLLRTTSHLYRIEEPALESAR